MSSMIYCHGCGKQIHESATSCPHCGAQNKNNPQQNSSGQKNKVVAAVFGILLGGLGIHKFYLGKVGLGILYLLFCWTGIPSIVGFIEGIIYLCKSDEDFKRVYG